MKSFKLIIISAFMVLIGCKKDNESEKLANFISSNNIDATLHPDGFYYKIINNGTGTITPTINSNVSVKYKGTLTNGTVFDEATTPISFYLYQVIEGWQKGVPLIKTGGKIILYLPPSLGYGNRAVQSIPANSILIFEIELISIL